MGLTLKVVDMCGCSRNRARSDNDETCVGPYDSPRLDDVDLARDPKISEMALDDIPVPRPNAVDTGDLSGVGGGGSQYVEVGNQVLGSQVVRLACEPAPERAPPIGRCD